MESSYIYVMPGIPKKAWIEWGSAIGSKKGIKNVDVCKNVNLCQVWTCRKHADVVRSKPFESTSNICNILMHLWESMIL